MQFACVYVCLYVRARHRDESTELNPRANSRYREEHEFDHHHLWTISFARTAAASTDIICNWINKSDLYAERAFFHDAFMR